MCACVCVCVCVCARARAPYFENRGLIPPLHQRCGAGHGRPLLAHLHIWSARVAAAPAPNAAPASVVAHVVGREASAAPAAVAASAWCVGQNSCLKAAGRRAASVLLSEHTAPGRPASSVPTAGCSWASAATAAARVAAAAPLSLERAAACVSSGVGRCWRPLLQRQHNCSPVHIRQARDPRRYQPHTLRRSYAARRPAARLCLQATLRCTRLAHHASGSPRGFGPSRAAESRVLLRRAASRAAGSCGSDGAHASWASAFSSLMRWAVALSACAAKPGVQQVLFTSATCAAHTPAWLRCAAFLLGGTHKQAARVLSAGIYLTRVAAPMVPHAPPCCA